MYSPSDIKRPDEFPQDPLTSPNLLYPGFGKAQYEFIIQRLLDTSQQQGRWISLAPTDFAYLFQDEEQVAASWLERMASETELLVKENGKFRLAQLVIGILADKYPAEKTN